MPQEMNVLRCYSCKIFQVHIVKKAKKWQCKICNEKQSFQRVFFQGSGKDCRTHVQKLNSLIQDELQDTATNTSFRNGSDMIYSHSDNSELEEPQIKAESKWAKYLEPSDITVQSNTVESFESEGRIYDDIDLVSRHLNNDDLMQGYSEYNCSSDTENNLETNVNCDNKNEDIDVAIHEQFYDASSANIEQQDKDDLHDEDVRKNVGKDKNIFDDHDDIDMSLDF